MSRSRSAAVLFVASAVLLGAALLAAAGGPGQKLVPSKAATTFGPIAKPLGNPVAYGFVQFDGSLRASSGNITVTWDGTRNRYTIQIAGVTYQGGTYITLVTADGNGGIYLPCTGDDNGALVVRMGRITGEPGIQAAFQFVTYKIL
jgi:hypothetical protein